MTTITLEKQESKFTIVIPKATRHIGKDGKEVYGIPPYEFPFTNKEEYLEWRAAWRREYKEHSANSRHNKNERNNALRAGGSSAWKPQVEVIILRCKARYLMEMRMESKILAGKMREESLKSII